MASPIRAGPPVNEYNSYRVPAVPASSLFVTNNIPVPNSPTQHLPLSLTQTISTSLESLQFTKKERRQIPSQVKKPMNVEWQYETVVAHYSSALPEQPVQIVEELAVFPLRKTADSPVENAKERRENERSAPPKERNEKERSAPTKEKRERAGPPPQEQVTYRIVEELKEVIQYVEKRIPVEVEKVVEHEVMREVEKVVNSEVIKHVEVHIEKFVERRVPVEKVIDRIVQVPIEKIVEIPIEKIIQVPIDRTVEITVPVDRVVEVPMERRVEVPIDRVVERVVEKQVYFEREPVYETRKRVVQVPVTTMHEQEVEEQFQVGFRTRRVPSAEYQLQGAETTYAMQDPSSNYSGQGTYGGGSMGGSPPSGLRTYTSAPTSSSPGSSVTSAYPRTYAPY